MLNALTLARATRRRVVSSSSSSSSSFLSSPSGVVGRLLSSASASTSARARRTRERNTRVAMYAGAAVIGALGATYASVPLYKLFCQATGFGGTTQRVILSSEQESELLREYEIDAEYERRRRSDDESDESDGLTDILRRRAVRRLDALYDAVNNMFVRVVRDDGNSSDGGKRRMGNTHGAASTWTDEGAASRLSSLRPRANGRLLRIHFDTSTSDVLPWTFKPTQPYVKVVPGETALCFFTATNDSPYPVTGVATYNVHPPKAGLYFNKVQCFCFEEQRLLPGETVDMPVFFYVDPDFEDDANLDRCNHITLSYTFFRTDVEDDEDDLANALEKHQREQELAADERERAAGNKGGKAVASNTDEALETAA